MHAIIRVVSDKTNFLFVALLRGTISEVTSSLTGLAGAFLQTHLSSASII